MRWLKTEYFVPYQLHWLIRPWQPIDSPGYHPHPVPVNWNGDGLVDILSRSHDTNHVSMPMASIFYWRNIGSLEQPIMQYESDLPWYAHYSGSAFGFVRDQAFNGCLVGSTAAGTGMRYLERVRADVFTLDALLNRGRLLGQARELKLEGYMRPVPLDADGNGTMDLACGDEPGFLTLVKNIGTAPQPAFAAPDKLKDPHGVELLPSDTNLFPLSRSKSYIGQVKPYLYDWDADGRLDLMVGGESGTVYLLHRDWLSGITHKVTVSGSTNHRPGTQP